MSLDTEALGGGQTMAS